jgi:hypothetical protein
MDLHKKSIICKIRREDSEESSAADNLVLDFLPPEP